MTSVNLYHVWLGLPADIDAPNHYQLLLLNPAECTRDAVVTAAKSQLAKLRQVASGGAAKDDVRRLAKEIESAANCLGRAKSREKYNQQLLSVLATPKSPPYLPAADAQFPPVTALSAETLPVAIPLAEDDYGSAKKTTELTFPERIGALAELASSTSAAPVESPVVAVADPGLHRRKRRSTPWGAYVGIVAAIALLGSAVLVAVQPQLLDRLLGRLPKLVADEPKNLLVTKPAHIPPDRSTESPLDRVLEAAPDSGVQSETTPDDVPPTLPESLGDGNAMLDGVSAGGIPSDAMGPAIVDLGETNDEPGMENPAAAPAPETRGVMTETSSPIAAPPASPTYSPAAVDILLAAALYSLAIGNTDESVELFSRIEVSQLSPEQADCAERLAMVADAHLRFQHCVLQVSGTIAGGENLQLDGDRSVGIVEASPELVVFKALGANRRYPPELLPTEIGLAFAQRTSVSARDLLVFRGVETVLQEVRRAQRGRSSDRQNLLERIEQLQADGSAASELDSIVEFCRIDLDRLMPDRSDPSLWTETTQDPDEWLKPLEQSSETARPYAALAAAVDQLDPAGRAILYRHAIEQLFAQQQQTIGLSIAAAVGQWDDPGGRVQLLEQVHLDRIPRERADSLVRILLDRIADENADGRLPLIRFCRQVIAKFGLTSYNHLLQQLAEPAE